MRGVVLYGPGDVRVEQHADLQILEPTDAIVRLTATCICGSDLWPFRGAEPVDHQVMGHEYVGVVERVGSEVRAEGRTARWGARAHHRLGRRRRGLPREEYALSATTASGRVRGHPHHVRRGRL